LNKEEMKKEALMMLRCQLKIFPNWKELYDSAIKSLFDNTPYQSLHHSYVTNMNFSAPDAFVCFAKTSEGENFWFEIDKRILHEVRKKGRWDLVPDIPSIIEEDDEI